MPTYQYSCTECGHFMEVVQSFSDDSLTVCPQCEGRLRKVFNAVGVVFKGSGFYRNDSRGPEKSGASGDSAKSEKSEKSDSAPGSKESAAKDSSGAKGSSSGTAAKDSSGSKGSSTPKSA